jgi:hypothetical protein
MLAMAGPERHKAVCISIASNAANRSSLADDSIDDWYLVQALMGVVAQSSQRGDEELGTRKDKKKGVRFLSLALLLPAFDFGLLAQSSVGVLYWHARYFQSSIPYP